MQAIRIMFATVIKTMMNGVRTAVSLLTRQVIVPVIQLKFGDTRSHGNRSEEARDTTRLGNLSVLEQN